MSKKYKKQECVAKGASSRVRVLFISAAVAECGILRQGYLLWLYCREIPRIVFTLVLLDSAVIKVKIIHLVMSPKAKVKSQIGVEFDFLY